MGVLVLLLDENGGSFNHCGADSLVAVRVVIVVVVNGGDKVAVVCSNASGGVLRRYCAVRGRAGVVGRIQRLLLSGAMMR